MTDEALGVNVVRAAERAGARKVVFSSVHHPSLAALSNHRAKQPAEAALYDSELDFTILQPAVFMAQLDASWATAQQGFVAQPYSADARIAYVDYAEVAEVAAAAFEDPRMAYGTFEPAAAGMHTRHDLARLMGRALAREAVAEAPPFEARAEQTGVPAGRVRDGLEAMMGHYDRYGFHGGSSLVLQTLLGREPTTVAAYVERLREQEEE